MADRTGHRAATVAVAVASLLAMAPTPVATQVRASEAGTVSQTVDGTVVTIEYSRPVARGRDALFGEIVEWGRTWTPGANWATTFEASADVRLNGQVLPQGKYSVWMIPREDTAWSLILHPDHRRFHTQPPKADEGPETLRLDVSPQPGPHMETLTWHFPVVTRDGATIRMHWGDTFVPLRLTVEPTKSVALSEGERRPYVGRYVMTRERPNGELHQIAVEIFEDGDRLRARMDPPPPWGVDAEIDLIPASARPGRDHRFNPGWYQDGALHDVDAETTLVFDVRDGTATGFEMWGLEAVMSRAVREP